MKIVDVNVLLYAVNRDAAEHEPVRRWWEAAINGQELIGLPWISISGFLRIATNPRLVNSFLRIEEATELVDQWLAWPNVEIIGERDRHWELFRGLLHATGAGGNRTTDAHLVALAISRDATLVSCDAGLAVYRGLRLENPMS